MRVYIFWGAAPNPASFLKRKRGKKNWERNNKGITEMKYLITLLHNGCMATVKNTFQLLLRFLLSKKEDVSSYIPCQSIASATFMKPAMFAPATRLPSMPNSFAASEAFL